MSAQWNPLQQQQQQQQIQRRRMEHAWWEQERRRKQQTQQAGLVSPPVDERVSHVEQEAARLRQQAAAGRLGPADLEARLSELMIQDQAGTWWTVGSQSGQWYRNDGQGWVGATRPGSVAGTQLVSTSQHASARERRHAHPVAHTVWVFLQVIVGFAAAAVAFRLAGGGSYQLFQEMDLANADVLSVVTAAIAGGLCLAVTWHIVRR